MTQAQKEKAPRQGRPFQDFTNEPANDTAPAYALQAAGLGVDEIETGRLVRCRTVEGKRGDRAGWYFAFPDGGLVYGDWRSGEVATWQPAGCRPPDREAIAQARREREAARQAEWAENAKRVGRTWRSAKPVQQGGLIARYLASRGVALPDGELRGTTLAYWHDGQMLGEYPAMLAPVLSPAGELIALHRTYLAHDGSGKADVPMAKKLTVAGGMLRGASVRLMAHGERLGVAEGIETALSAAALFGVPCWAAVSAPMLKSWQAPAGVRVVDVFADHDANGVGQEAAAVLAQRLACEGLEVRIHTPERPGDWSDVLCGEVAR